MSARDQWGAEAARATAALLRERIGVRAPVAAIVLGSGLGNVVARIGAPRTIRYAEIPGFSSTAVDGHAGELFAGTLAGREVLAFAGRFHMYEGHLPRASEFPVRVAHALGAPVWFASNASGGINPRLKPGDLVLVDDHINLTWQNPLAGPTEPGDARFPDMSGPYSSRLKELARAAAAEAGVPLGSGVYAGLVGPAYETPAEVRMLAALGADLTGMSTVAEAIVAAALGMECVAVSLVTNAAAGLTDAPVRHEDVMAAAGLASAGFERLLERFISRL